MKKHISFLRGINVSGQKKIKMADLKTLYEELNLKNVKTYIQSGNVVFESKENDTKKLNKMISEKINFAYNFEVPCMVITNKKLEWILKNNPFLNDSAIEITRLYVTMLAEIPDRNLFEKAAKINCGRDQMSLIDDIVYLSVPNGYGKTKLSNNYIENKLRITATTRNWKTMATLLALAAEN